MNDPHPIHRVASGSASGKAASAAPSHTLRGAPSRLLNVGYGNLVTASRVVAIVAPAASPMRRLRHEAAERGKLVDATEGRRTRSIVILDSDHVVLSAINPETLAARLVEDEPGSQA